MRARLLHTETRIIAPSSIFTSKQPRKKIASDKLCLHLIHPSEKLRNGRIALQKQFPLQHNSSAGAADVQLNLLCFLILFKAFLCNDDAFVYLEIAEQYLCFEISSAFDEWDSAMFEDEIDEEAVYLVCVAFMTIA